MKFLNNHKTNIGAFLWLIVAIFTLVSGQPVEGFDGPETWGDLLQTGLAIFAGIFSVIGLIHKAIKGEL